MRQLQGKNVMLSTNKFWDAMSSPRFIRLSLRRGEIDGNQFETAKAPEEIDGFVESKVELIIDFLKPRRWWQF